MALVASFISPVCVYARRVQEAFLRASLTLLLLVLAAGLVGEASAQTARQQEGPPSAPSHVLRARMLPASPLRVPLREAPAERPPEATISSRTEASRTAASRTTAVPRKKAAPAAADAGRAPTGNARFPSWNLPPTLPGQAMVYAHVGYGQINDEFDADGNTRPAGSEVALNRSLRQAAALVGVDPSAIPEGTEGTVTVPSRLQGQINSVNLRLGGALDVYANPFFSVALGADFQASQQNFETDLLRANLSEATGTIEGTNAQIPLQQILASIGSDVVLPASAELTPDQNEAVPESVDSGFQAQALTLFAQAKTRFLALRGGFQFDLGNEPDLAVGEREVSDRQNAILLGLTASYPLTSRFRVYGGVDGWFTLENEEALAGGGLGVAYDEGNSYAAQVGADVDVIPALALGAALTYRYRTEASTDADDTETEPLEVGSSGYNLGVSPYVNFTPPGFPLTLYAKGAVQDEYRDFSLSLAGENEFAPRLGITLGAVYHL